ncbi:hypothetical protein BSG1_00180 [Bacillus sp. SG-1]|nr:hypothetical protein BSG1_00180 [Bacillus sp. SG-1]
MTEERCSISFRISLFNLHPYNSEFPCVAAAVLLKDYLVLIIAFGEIPSAGFGP